jgi:GNAT superfamily N-acetyltransferase
MDTIAINDPAELDNIAGLDAFPLLAPEDLARQAPDAHWILLDRDHVAAARCSLWHSNVPALPGHRLGLIGHYAARDAEYGGRMLEHAGKELAATGRILAVGPMDGSTWRRYRFVTERGDAPPFFLEPDNPDDWPAHFTQAGFSALATYTSALTHDLHWEDPRLPRIQERLNAEGVTIRPIDPARYDADLEAIYTLSLISFENNFLYTPIARDEFLDLYRKVVPYVQPELVLMAEHAGRLAGFLFAVPDWAQRQLGEPVDTIILKTVAVLPGRAYAGLGSVLLARSQTDARALGYRRAIHALMHDSNHSRATSERFTHTIRRYTLFSRPLP